MPFSLGTEVHVLSDFRCNMTEQWQNERENFMFVTQLIYRLMSAKISCINSITCSPNAFKSVLSNRLGRGAQVRQDVLPLQPGRVGLHHQKIPRGREELGY